MLFYEKIKISGHAERLRFWRTIDENQQPFFIFIIAIKLDEIRNAVVVFFFIQGHFAFPALFEECNFKRICLNFLYIFGFDFTFNR